MTDKKITSLEKVLQWSPIAGIFYAGKAAGKNEPTVTDPDVNMRLHLLWAAYQALSVVTIGGSALSAGIYYSVLGLDKLLFK